MQTSFLILLILAYIYLAIYINNKDKYYCKDWDKSLNNTYINNNKSIYSCSVNIPKEKCLIFILFNFSFYSFKYLIDYGFFDK